MLAPISVSVLALCYCSSTSETPIILLEVMAAVYS